MTALFCELTPASRTSDDAYLEMQMNKVSRSFSVVVSCLKEPLLGYVSIAYLLCRVADNIEDCTEPQAWKTGRFAELERMLHDPQQSGAYLAEWNTYNWQGLTPGERKLMGLETGPALWRLYSRIPTSNIGRWRWAQA